ncbi:MAG: hypothetical protein JW904_03455 [Spirochaetales bacterium]|nr:hypothetical protein [Spirochaetales bacterium]
MENTQAANSVSAGIALREGWNFAKKNYGKLFLIFLVGGLIIGAVTGITYGIAALSNTAMYGWMHNSGLLMIVVTILNVILTSIYFAVIFLVDFPIYVGIFSAVKKGMAGEQFDVADIFTPFKTNYKNVVLTGMAVVGILLATMVTAFGILGGLESFLYRLSHDNFIPLFGGLVPLYYIAAFAFIFVINIFLLYAYLIVIDTDMKAGKVISRSFAYGRKYLKPTLLYVLAFIGVAVVVSLAMGIIIGIFTFIDFAVMQAANMSVPIFSIISAVIAVIGMILIMPVIGGWSYGTCTHLYLQIKKNNPS